MKIIEKNIISFAGCMTVFLVILSFQTGCSGNLSPAASAASETKAMSLLKQFQAAQNVFRMESGQYGIWSELISRNLISDELAAAFDNNPHPLAVNGYLFSEIQSADKSKRAGLCAYPENGKGKVILMLLDVDDRDEWSFYTADNSKWEGRVTIWPSQQDLQTKFTKMRKYSPSEGVTQARKLAN